MSPNYVVLKCIINLDYFYFLHFPSSKPKNHFLPSFKFITLAIYKMEWKPNGNPKQKEAVQTLRVSSHWFYLEKDSAW